MKNQQAFTQEQEALWEKMQIEKEMERRRADQKLRELEEERQRLELALEREKEERERLDQIERQKKAERDIIANKRIND